MQLQISFDYSSFIILDLYHFDLSQGNYVFLKILYSVSIDDSELSLWMWSVSKTYDICMH